MMSREHSGCQCKIVTTILFITILCERIIFAGAQSIRSLHSYCDPSPVALLIKPSDDLTQSYELDRRLYIYMLCIKISINMIHCIYDQYCLNWARQSLGKTTKTISNTRLFFCAMERERDQPNRPSHPPRVDMCPRRARIVSSGMLVSYGQYMLPLIICIYG